MRGVGVMSKVVAAWLAALAALQQQSNTVDASAVKTGAPEHLVAKGGECVRLFHSQGAIGCRSVTNADMAVLLALETESDVSDWQKQSTSEVQGKKPALVMPEHLVTKEFIEATKTRVAGIFAYPDGSKNVSFAAQMPQGEGSPDAVVNPFASAKIAWNPSGVGLMGQAIPYPVVMLESLQLGNTFRDKAKKNAQKSVGSTFTAFMKYYYGPETMDSRKCLAFRNIQNTRSPKCDPIGGQSSWGVRGKIGASETIAVMAGMDAYAFSQILVPGANEGASGVVAMLAAVKALQAIPDEQFGKQIVFAAFQAEKFGFVGSRRFLSDIRNAAKDPSGFCKALVKDSSSPLGATFCTSPLIPNLEYTKLNLSTITYALAVDQVGLLPTKDGNFSIHVNPNAPKEAAALLVDTIAKVPSAKSKFSESNVTTALPPTPMLSFVNADEFGQQDLVGAVISGYDSTFAGDGSYASRHDQLDNLNVDAVVQAAQVLAETVYTLGAANATQSDLESLRVDKDLVRDMLRCISTNWTCDLMMSYSKPFVETMIKNADLTSDSWPQRKKPISLYAGTLDSERHPYLLTLGNGVIEDIEMTDASKWSDDKHRVRLFPNGYEVFVRGFLASALADKKATTSKECKKSQDCADKGLECVYPSVCASQRAYFHDAYSPGLKRVAYGTHDVVNESMPLWTEPMWDDDIGSYVFPNPGETIGWIALLLGLVILGVSVWTARWIFRGVQKMKLL